MNDRECSQTIADTADDAPTGVVIPSFVETLPERLAGDRYARFLAEECDRMRADRDRERADHKATRDLYTEALVKGTDQAITLVETRGKLATANARLDARSAWTAIAPYALLAVALICIAAMTIAGH